MSGQQHSALVVVVTRQEFQDRKEKARLCCDVLLLLAVPNRADDLW